MVTSTQLSPRAGRSTADLLATWEHSRHGPPWQRAAVLLAGLAGSGDLSEAAGLDVGRRDRMLLALHLELFGGTLDATASCEACGQEVEASAPVEMLLDEPAAQPAGADGWTTVRHRSRSYRLRLPTSDDLAAVAALDATQARRVLLSRCVPDAPAALLDDPGFQQAAAARMADADPCGDLLLTLRCPSCDAVWTATLDAGDFVWQQVDTWAHRLLYDVQLLAGTYGWSERDILDLPTWRREYYARGLGA